MEFKQAFVLFSVSLACYLIFSITFVSAYQVGEVFSEGKTKFILEPVLRIVDDLEPINCESSGYISFQAYVENIPGFDINNVEAFLENPSKGETFNITSAISCQPRTNLISNEEIKCNLNVNRLLSRLPYCPFDKTVNNFYLTLDISYGNNRVKISDGKDFILTKSGTKPKLEVNFEVSAPPYPVPEINCKTGSEIDVPVVIKNAETMYGDITWSFLVNGTSYGGNLIDCEKILTRDGEGKENIYICELVIANTAFPGCAGNEGVEIGVRAQNKDYDIHGNFTTRLVSEDLNLGLSLSRIGKLECQIIDENGTCVPKEPQQNVTARITGNVPAKIKVFETRYKLGDSNITTTYCKRIASNKYECLAFITIDQLPMPASENQKTTKSRELTMFFDVKYLNYYTNISDSTNVTLEGNIINELLNTMNVLEKDKDFFSDVKNLSDKLSGVYEWVDTLSLCCLINKIIDQLAEGAVKEALLEVAKMYLWGSAQTTWQKVIAILIGNGPALIGCIAEKAMEDIDEEMQNLQDFEDDQITAPLDIPSFVDVLTQYYPSCRAQNFWDQIASSWKGWLCGGILWVTGLGAAICPILASPVANAIFKAINLFLLVVSLLILLNTYNEAMKNIALARERINLGLAVSNIMTEYADKLANTMETLATSLATNAALINITNPVYDTVKLLFISDRTGVLNNEDDICSGDSITIDYNFEKLNQTEGFVSELSITPNRRGDLIFDKLKGTYGPYFTDTLLGTNPLIDHSEMYTFTLRYQDKALHYDLYYVNHTCI